MSESFLITVPHLIITAIIIWHQHCYRCDTLSSCVGTWVAHEPATQTAKNIPRRNGPDRGMTVA